MDFSLNAADALSAGDAANQQGPYRLDFQQQSHAAAEDAAYSKDTRVTRAH